MSPQQNGTILLVIIVLFVGFFALRDRSSPQQQTSNIPNPASGAATTTSQTLLPLPVASTTLSSLPAFSITKAAAAKVANKSKTFSNQSATSLLAIPTPPQEFSYIFNVPETFEESDSQDDSGSDYWWLDSGARLISTGSFGETIQGALPPQDRWRIEYAATNGVDSDNGKYPQNLFRLVSKSAWQSVREDVFFKITADNLTDSDNRNESNGLLLMSSYQDRGDTLYYAGIRVDGNAVIKKKYKGEYYTMAEDQIFPGTYARDASPNLLPHQIWIGLRSETSEQNGVVTVTLYMGSPDGKWVKLLSAKDNGQEYDHTPIISGGRIGIRTDFMDVEFQNFHAEQL